ncbi:hypothetical protein [Photorhabdus kayaii]|uniref:hypothetical protein n=1 Tax=Photorhabdus kayaii TaxID=230088 RepID=UPI0021D4D3AB|nr:hypothetical protein [Photorhabdus kayaii]MCT8352281.1 hypothetical protein [Photorhabdus kayaii]
MGLTIKIVEYTGNGQVKRKAEQSLRFFKDDDMAAESSIILSENWQYATAIAQIVSAFAVTIGVIVAICAITSNSKTARKSQTAIFLSESRVTKLSEKSMSQVGPLDLMSMTKI